MMGQLSVSASQAGSAYLVFAAFMLAVGPFHAYLGDAYKRKSVLQFSLLIMLVAMLGYAFVRSYAGMLLLAAVQGACFGLTATAGITVAIDITTSARRSAGNLVYAWASRMGMLVGVGVGALLFRLYDFRTVVYAAVGTGLLCLYFASRVYVAFRAPIGTPLCNLDRFLLPRGWLPAINLLLAAFVAGVLLPLLVGGHEYIPIVALAVLVLLTIPFTRMFVKLSHHCQRSTANTTCHLAMDLGVLLGLSAACRFMGLHLYSPDGMILCIATEIAVVALLLAVVTLAYYKKKKVR